MKIRWTTYARRDLDEIAEWISQDNLASSKKGGSRIRDAASRLAEAPYSGRPGSIAGTRFKLALPYPYIIVYEVNEDVQEVWILRVFYMARDRR